MKCASAMPVSRLPAVEKLDHFLRDPRLISTMIQLSPWDEKEMERREKLGDVCYMVVEDGQCVHFSWMTQKQRYIKELAHEVSLPPRTAWIYNCFTSPGHRGHSLYPHVLKTIINDLKTTGREMVWIDLEAKNEPSFKGVMKAGFHEVALMQRIVVFSLLTFHKAPVIIDTRWMNVDGQLLFNEERSNADGF